MRIGSRDFDLYNNTYIMGILNITPDSFSDGGRFISKPSGKPRSGISHPTVIDMDAVLRECEQMIADGADIIDIGGESTRPGAPPVSGKEELERVLPVIEAVKQRFDIPISVDTYKAVVAMAAVDAGARLINDVWGLKGDKEMAATVAKSMDRYDGVAVCIMHNRHPADSNISRGDQKKPYTEDLIPITKHGEDIDYGYRKADRDRASTEKSDIDLFLEDVRSDLTESVHTASGAGVKLQNIILDPGVGFAKTYEQNLAVIRRIKELECPDAGSENRFPVLLGCSRKSVIGKTLDKPVDDRLYGTLATTAYAVSQGVGIVRVHDVAANADVIKLMRSILRAG